MNKRGTHNLVAEANFISVGIRIVLGMGGQLMDQARISFEPREKILYSQNFEDLRVMHALPEIKNGTYVEVGAQHPLVGSPTAALYALGWNGILVEPEPFFSELLRKQRPRDTVIEGGCGSTRSEMLLSSFGRTGLSTLISENVDLAIKRGFSVQEESSVNIYKLDDLLKEHLGTNEIHFLSIDVEGFENQVLKGGNLKYWKPWIICIEAIIPGTADYSGELNKEFLLLEGYLYVFFDGVNDWFIHQDHSSLGKQLLLGMTALDRGIGKWRLFDEEQKQISLNLRRNYVHKSTKLAYVENRSENIVVETVQDLNSQPQLYEFKQLHKQNFYQTLLNIFQKYVPKYFQQLVGRQKHYSFGHQKYLQPEFSRARFNSFASRPETLQRTIPRWASVQWATVNEISREEALEIQKRLESNSNSDWADVESRLDGNSDEGLILRKNLDFISSLGLRQTSKPNVNQADCVLIDGRSLQNLNLVNRGIGFFSKSCLDQVLKTTDPPKVTILLDTFEPNLDIGIDLSGVNIVYSLNQLDIEEFGLFIQLSPLTANPIPIIKVLKSNVRKISVLFDFIPGKFPDIYLPTFSDIIEYRARLLSLSFFDMLLPISKSIEAQIKEFLPSFKFETVAAVPEAILPRGSQLSIPESHSENTKRIGLFIADEPRKNSKTVLSAIQHIAEKSDEEISLFIFGYSSASSQINALKSEFYSSKLQMFFMTGLSVSDRDQLLSSLDFNIVPSLAEGLSLPVIESILCGVPVLCSGIPPHTELVGTYGIVRKNSVRSWIRKIESQLKFSNKLAINQWKQLRQIPFASLEETLKFEIDNLRSSSRVSPKNKQIVIHNKNTPRKIDIYTPWKPSRTGVADYSAASLSPLTELADVRFVTVEKSSTTVSSDANVVTGLEKPRIGASILSILGNSAFHIDPLWTLREFGGIALAHDSKMIEFYKALRGVEAVSNLVSKTGIKMNEKILNDWIFKNEYPDLGFAEIGSISKAIIFHSGIIAERVAIEANCRTLDLPFIPLRTPEGIYSRSKELLEAKSFLGYSNNSVVISTIGFFDERTKQHSLLLESCLWLRQWGIDVKLVFVGPVTSGEKQTLLDSIDATQDWIEFTGYVDNSELIKRLVASDVVCQLRQGSLPMRSAPVVDAVAYGVPVVASESLVGDLIHPSWVFSLPYLAGPIQLAEVLLQAIEVSEETNSTEEERREFLKTFNPKNYSNKLYQYICELG